VKARSAEDSRLWYALGAAGLLAGLALRLQLASVAEMPGHGDSAFYYTVAKNIVDGRGLVVDYVVYFFLGLVPLTHYAGDFWNPLAAILLSLPMFVLGQSVFNALLASIAAGLIPAVVGYLAGRRFARSVMVGVLTGLLTFFTPFEVVFSATTEAIIFYGAFGGLALYLAYKGRAQPRYFLLAAMCTGVAHLVRQDGVLLIVTLLTCVLLAPIPWSRRLGWVAVASGVHLVVISPLLIHNLVSYGTVLQPGPSSTAFMTAYEDFHAYNKEMTWDTLRAEWGMRGIVRRRLHAASENLSQLKAFAHPLFAFLASLGFVNLAMTRARIRELHVMLPVAIYSILIYGFYTVVAIFSGPGSLPKSLAVVLPFACILVVDLFTSRLRSVPLLVAGIVLLAAYLGYRGYETNYWSTAHYNQEYRDYDTLRGLVSADASRRGRDLASVVIMARNVWDVHAGTGFRAVMIPNNDLDTILEVAAHYGAEYLLLPAPRKALDDIYMGTTPDSRITFLAAIDGTDWMLYRLMMPP
jgi:hypothetical protein